MSFIFVEIHHFFITCMVMVFYFIQTQYFKYDEEYWFYVSDTFKIIYMAFWYAFAFDFIVFFHQHFYLVK